MGDESFIPTRPDFDVIPSQYAAGEVDLAEAMVRLGSPDTTTRTGRVVYLTGFEIDRTDWRDSSGTVTIDTATPYQGIQALQFTPEALSPFQADIKKVLPLLSFSRVSLEAMVAMPSSVNIWSMQIRAQGDGLAGFGSIKAYAAGGKLEYLDAALSSLPSTIVYTEFDPGQGALFVDANTYWMMKLVVDLRTQKYVRFELNDQVFDLSEFDLFNLGDAYPARVDLTLRAIDETGAQTPLKVDNVIFRIDEP